MKRTFSQTNGIIIFLRGPHDSGCLVQYFSSMNGRIQWIKLPIHSSFLMFSLTKHYSKIPLFQISQSTLQSNSIRNNVPILFNYFYCPDQWWSYCFILLLCTFVISSDIGCFNKAIPNTNNYVSEKHWQCHILLNNHLRVPCCYSMNWWVLCF